MGTKKNITIEGKPLRMSDTMLAKYNMHEKKKKQIIEWYFLGIRKADLQETIEDYLTELKRQIFEREKIDIDCSSLSKR